jgi:predicted transposase/invertase (TIGR01784 family)
MVTEQLKAGVAYESIKKVVSIIILDWHLTEKEQSIYHHRFRLYDEKSGYGFPDLFEINTLELPKLPRRPDGTPLYNWLSIFTAQTREEFDMAAKTSPEIAQAVGVIMELSEDERTRLLAESREKYRRDEAARRKLAFQTGEREGLLKVARAALQKNIPPEDIASLTGLSLDEIRALAAHISANH